MHNCNQKANLETSDGTEELTEEPIRSTFAKTLFSIYLTCDKLMSMSEIELIFVKNKIFRHLLPYSNDLSNPSKKQGGTAPPLQKK